MAEHAPHELPDVYPFMHYEDAPAAIDWLERAFGFARQLVVPDSDGAIVHAQLRVGRGMIMLGSARENPLGVALPRALGAVTGGVYVYVGDVESHYQQAVAAGATIVKELHDTDYGSREYAARDPEGHLWGFGTYRPETAATG